MTPEAELDFDVTLVASGVPGFGDKVEMRDGHGGWTGICMFSTPTDAIVEVVSIDLFSEMRVGTKIRFVS